MTKEIIEKIKENKNVELKDLEIFFSDEVNDQERKEFLLALNKRGIKAEDIKEFVNFLLPKDFPKLKDAIDICGTGGSKLRRINTSTIASFILASCGVKIAKHGNRAASGRFGSFDLLEKIGINIDLEANEVKAVFEKENLAFIFAQKFFPAMKYFAKARMELKIPTIFNILGPLLSPPQVDRQIIGTNSVENARLIAEAAKLLNRKHIISLTSHNHLDEVTTTGTTYCVEMKDGEITEFEVNPKDFGLQKVDFSQIEGGDADFNTKIAKDILSGKCETTHYDLILVNCAFVLKFEGICETYLEAIELVKKKIKDGEAIKKLEKMVKVTNEF